MRKPCDGLVFRHSEHEFGGGGWRTAAGAAIVQAKEHPNGMPEQRSRSDLQSSSAQAGAPAPAVAAKRLKVRGRFLTAVALPVDGGAGESYLAALDDLLRQSPGFFSDAPLVLDLAEAEGLDAEDGFSQLLQALRSRGLTPFAVQNATDRQKAEAARLGLSSLQGGRETSLPRKTAPAAGAPTPPEQAPATVLVTEPVRSGQRIYAERGDVVVVGSVSSGAEVVAHGNVHVYGRLRGRALAGVHGDEKARIFCHSLEAELIAIAGLYKTSEEMGDAFAQQPVHAFLEDDALRIVALK